jgi:hypothetical protein
MIHAKHFFGWDALANIKVYDIHNNLIFNFLFLHHGPSKTVFRYSWKGKDEIERVTPGELVLLRNFLETDLGWDLGSSVSDSTLTTLKKGVMHFELDAEVHNKDIDGVCKVGDKIMTRCDLLVQHSLIMKPSLWNLGFHTLCRKYRLPLQKKVVKTMQKVSILKKKPQYFFDHVTNIKTLRKMDLVRLCQKDINWNYLKTKLSMPGVKVMIAKRFISKLSEICKPPNCMETRKGICKAPDLWSVYRALPKKKKEESYETFKTGLMTRFPDPDERNRYLCALPLKPVGYVMGGVCIYTESESEIIIWILCSDRSMGKALLEQFKSMGKTIVIDNPLDNVIGFYTKCGFTAVDPFRMIYTPPPKQVDKDKKKKPCVEMEKETQQQQQYQRFLTLIQQLRREEESTSLTKWKVTDHQQKKKKVKKNTKDKT